MDKPTEKDDRKLAQHIVSLYLSEKYTNNTSEFIPVEKFTLYLNLAKKIQPLIMEDAGQALVEYYVQMRRLGTIGNSKTITFTTRQLESMIRLAEAHAKMRLSSTVDLQDVEEAHRYIIV